MGWLSGQDSKQWPHFYEHFFGRTFFWTYFFLDVLFFGRTFFGRTFFWTYFFLDVLLLDVLFFDVLFMAYFFKKMYVKIGWLALLRSTYKARSSLITLNNFTIFFSERKAQLRLFSICKYFFIYINLISKMYVI